MPAEALDEGPFGRPSGRVALTRKYSLRLGYLWGPRGPNSLASFPGSCATLEWMAEAAGKKVVLVVDDNEAMRENLCECLVEEGYGCWAVPSADDALRRLEAEASAPDLVLIDLRMPGMTVEQFVSHMKERVAWATVPIILSTGAEREEIPSGLAIDGVLFRPFDPARLFELVRGIIQGRTGSDAHVP